MMSNIKLWFLKGFNAGKSVQKLEHKHKKVDGKSIWGEIEKSLGIFKDMNLINYKGENIKYNIHLNKIYKKMDVIIKKFGMNLSEFCPKSSHFFMQLKNIVKSKSDFNVQLNRVVQLGFNAGQLSVFIEKNTLCEDRRQLIVDLVKTYNMLDLDTYIDKENQDIINKKYLNGSEFDLTNKKGGGNLYYEKYKNYKAKYLTLMQKNN
jgi:hypothetical protein